jgi:hypothetical protein
MLRGSSETQDIRRQSRNNLVNALSRLRQGYGVPGDNAFYLGYFAR